MDSVKFGPNTKICSDFYEIWHSQQIELKLNKKDINYIGGFTIPSNIYDGMFLRNYQLAALIRHLFTE